MLVDCEGPVVCILTQNIFIMISAYLSVLKSVFPLQTGVDDWC